MKNLIAIIFVLFSAVSCKEEVKTDEALSEFTANSDHVAADGQSTVAFSVQLPTQTSPDRRSVIFSSTGGSLSPGSNKSTVKATFEGEKLVAKAELKAPLSPGTLSVSVQPEFDSYQDFILTKTITATPSTPASIKIDPTSFGIGSNFINAVRIKGQLRNSTNKFVSKGTKVLYEDFLSSGVSANGRFRSLQASSNDSSYVSAIYSANSYPIGTNITITCTVLDDQGLKTSITNSLLLTINQ